MRRKLRSRRSRNTGRRIINNVPGSQVSMIFSWTAIKTVYWTLP
jgi:hypothetical protein